MLYGFCISDIEPFNSTRYYAHIDKNNAIIMYYTPSGYEEFSRVSFQDNLDIPQKYDIIRKSTKELHTKLESEKDS